MEELIYKTQHLLTLGQEFSGYHSQLKKMYRRIENALKEIYYLAQGGTAVGTGLNTRKNFDKKIIKEISKITKFLLNQQLINLQLLQLMMK